MTVENPWTTLSSSYVYQNPWIKVREDKVIQPDKKPGIYGVVETSLATGVVALTQDREVVLVGQYRYPTRHYSWEIVEGAAHEGELGIDAVRRELREESGVVAGSIMQLGPLVHLSNSFTDEVAALFLAWDLSETDASPEGTEILAVRRVPFSQAIGMVRRGEITDAMSVIALERTKLVLESLSLPGVRRGEG